MLLELQNILTISANICGFEQVEQRNKSHDYERRTNSVWTMRAIPVTATSKGAAQNKFKFIDYSHIPIAAATRACPPRFCFSQGVVAKLKTGSDLRHISYIGLV